MRTLLMVGALLSVGCGAARFQKVSVRSDADDGQLYRAVVRELADARMTLASQDDAAGMIATEWKETKSLSTPYRFRWVVAVGNGAVAVDSQCEKFDKGGPYEHDDAWVPCARQSINRQQRAQDLAERIAARAAGGR